MFLDENEILKTQFVLAIYAYTFYLLYFWEIYVERVLWLI